MTLERWTSSSRAKLARADQHLDAFNRETRRWGDSDPLAVARESNADGSEHVFRLRFKAQPPVWDWALILGDALHNLRGALDHMVYALAVIQTGKDPPDDETKLAFPICSEPKFFEGQRYRIRSLSKPTQTAIEKAQPYNRLKPGKWFMPLWWLAQLHDIDKHRFAGLSVIGAVPKEIVIDADPGTYEVYWNTGRLVDGAPILRLVLAKPDLNMYVDLKVTGGVVLDLKGRWRPFSIYWITRHIRHEVAVICRYLEGFFPR